MPRKTKADGSVPRAPRARKKNSTNQEHVKPIVEPSIYDPMMGMNGMNNMMIDESLYAHPHHHPPPHHLPPHHHPHHAPLPHPHAHPHAHPHGPPPPDYSYGYGHQPPYAQDSSTNNPYILASNQPPPQPPPQANLQPQPSIAQQQQPPPGVLQQTLQGQAQQSMIMRNSMAAAPPPQPPPAQAALPPPPSAIATQNASAPPNMATCPSPLEYRIHDMNRRIQSFNNNQISEKDHAQWWDAFSHEFFDDEARLTVTLFNEINPNQSERYTIPRQLIPRFFRSFVASGMKDLCYIIRSMSRESQLPNGLISFENDSILQIVRYNIPCLIETQTDCKFNIEFTPFDEILNYRIHMWHIQLRSCQEYYIADVSKELQLADKNQPVTRLGLSQATIYSLSVTRILEPMQVLMGHQKMHGLPPHETMRRTLFNHRSAMQEMQQRMSQQPQMLPPAAPEEKPKPTRKRTRKGQAAANPKTKKPTASPTRATIPPPFPTSQMSGTFNTMSYQDVMVVGEPSMMGGEFGEDDERQISRIANSQYDPANMQPVQQTPKYVFVPPIQ